MCRVIFDNLGLGGGVANRHPRSLATEDRSPGFVIAYALPVQFIHDYREISARDCKKRREFVTNIVKVCESVHLAFGERRYYAKSLFTIAVHYDRITRCTFGKCFNHCYAAGVTKNVSNCYRETI